MPVIEGGGGEGPSDRRPIKELLEGRLSTGRSADIWGVLHGQFLIQASISMGPTNIAESRKSFEALCAPIRHATAPSEGPRLESNQAGPSLVTRLRDRNCKGTDTNVCQARAMVENQLKTKLGALSSDRQRRTSPCRGRPDTRGS